jgi:hypothetical protein
MAMWAEVDERSERADANTALAKRVVFMFSKRKEERVGVFG